MSNKLWKVNKAKNWWAKRSDTYFRAKESTILFWDVDKLRFAIMAKIRENNQKYRNFIFEGKRSFARSASLRFLSEIQARNLIYKVI